MKKLWKLLTRGTKPEQGMRVSSQGENEWESAEMAFKRNMEEIIPLLRGVHSECIANKEQWCFVINKIANMELASLWDAGSKRPALWITCLQSFGLQADLIEVFEGVKGYEEMYDVEDGSALEKEKKYRVIFPCWLYTDEKNSKSVALKGVVKTIQ